MTRVNVTLQDVADRFWFDERVPGDVVKMLAQTNELLRDIAPEPPRSKREKVADFVALWRERLSNAWAALRGKFPYED